MTVAHELACQTLNKSASSAKRYYDQRLRPKLLKLVINSWSTTRGIAVSIMLSGSDAISRTEGGGVVSRVDDVNYKVQPVYSRQVKVLISLLITSHAGDLRVKSKFTWNHCTEITILKTVHKLYAGVQNVRPLQQLLYRSILHLYKLLKKDKWPRHSCAFMPTTSPGPDMWFICW